MRIRLTSPRSALSVAAVVFLSLSGAAHAQDVATAVNQGSPATERILLELRAGKSADAGGDGDAIADEGVDATTVPQDGSLAAPAVDSAASQDGLLRDSAVAAPDDGDLSADGKLVTPAEVAADPADAEPPLPVPVRATPVPPDQRPDARSVSGRPRSVVEDGRSATARQSATPADDVTLQDDTPDEAVAATPVPAARDPETQDDPYAPVGIRIGGFRLQPSIRAQMRYSDNVRQSKSNLQGDGEWVLRPSLTAASQWSRHFVGLDLRGADMRYAHLDIDGGTQLNANMRVRLDIAETSSLEGEAGYDFGQVPSSDPRVAVGAAVRPTTLTKTAGGAFDQRFNRVALRLHGTVADTAEGDSGAGGLHYRDATLDFRAGYEMSTALTAFTTGRTIGRQYSDATGASASERELRIGVESDKTAKLSGSFSIGAASAAGNSGFVADSSVVWLPSALTTLTFGATTDLELTTASGATALRSTSLALEMRHQFRRWLTMLVGLSAVKRSYAGLSLIETEISGHTGLEYDLSREWALLGDYQRTNVTSSDAARSYAEDQFTVGVRLQR